MFRKKDLLVIVGALLLAALVWGGMQLSRGRQSLTGMVEIWANGALVDTVALGEAREIRVEQENGDVNIIQIGLRGVQMAHSSCKNQLCVSQGEVTLDNWTRRSMGRSIICLPNRVVVELQVEGAEQALIDEDLPDV